MALKHEALIEREFDKKIEDYWHPDLPEAFDRAITLLLDAGCTEDLAMRVVGLVYSATANEYGD